MTDGSGNVVEVSLEGDVPVLRVPSDRSALLAQALSELGFPAQLVRTVPTEDDPNAARSWSGLLDAVRLSPGTSPDDVQDVVDSLEFRSDQHIWRIVV